MAPLKYQRLENNTINLSIKKSTTRNNSTDWPRTFQFTQHVHKIQLRGTNKLVSGVFMYTLKGKINTTPILNKSHGDIRTIKLSF